MALRPHAPSATLLSGIYAIVNESPRVCDLAQAIVRAGVRIVQYRAKNGIDASHARDIRAITSAGGALFIVNDAWQEVERYGADGAHLGPDDAQSAQLANIRSALRGKILGLSCGTAAEAREASIAGADYIGAGCVFPTSSKDDAGEPIGIEGLKEVAAATALPVAAIGGITPQNLRLVRESGVSMAAVISALSEPADPAAAAIELRRIWQDR